MEILDHDQDDKIIDAYQQYIQSVTGGGGSQGGLSRIESRLMNDDEDENNNNNNNNIFERDQLLDLVHQVGEEGVVNFYKQRIEHSKLLAPYMKAILKAYTLLPLNSFTKQNKLSSSSDIDNDDEQDNIFTQDEDDQDDNSDQDNSQDENDDYDRDNKKKKKKSKKQKKKLKETKKSQSPRTLQSFEVEYENKKVNFMIEFIKQISNSRYPLGDENDLVECIATINSECDGLKINHIQGMLTAIQAGFLNNDKVQLLELYPKFLSQALYLQSCNNNNRDDIATFQTNSINSITKPTWKKHLLGGIIQMFNDISLSKQDLTKIVDNTIECLSQLKVIELPEVIYKLTLLSSHGLKGYILAKIVELLDSVTTPANENDYVWLSNQAFIAFQINISVKQDMNIGKEFLKLEHSLSRFNIIFLLSIAAIPRFKSQVITILKSLVLKHLKSTKYELKHIMDLANTIKDSEEWNQLVEPFLAFAICLIDTNAMVITDTIRRARDIGRELLEMLFGNQSAQSTIMDEIVGRIQTKSDNLHPWFLLLTKLATKEQAFLQKSFSKLKDSLDYIQYYSTSTVRQLITAFDLICRGEGNTSLQDGIIITLKKSMFKKETEARAAAITGFLQILKDITPANPNQPINKLVFEILGTLRRALGQQASIRSLLYSGLKDLVKSKKYIGNYICEILYFHFQQLYHHDINEQFFQSFSRAEIGGRVLSEPFDQLVNCIQFCIRNTSRHPNQNSLSLDQLTKLFDEFVKLMSSFDIRDKKYSSPLEISLIIGVLEALIEYNATSPTPDYKTISKLSNMCIFAESMYQSKLKEEQQQHQQQQQHKGTKGAKKRKRVDDDENEEEQDESDGGADVGVQKKKGKEKKIPLSKEHSREPLSALCIIRLFELVDEQHNELNSSNKTTSDQRDKLQNLVKFIYISLRTRLEKMFDELKAYKELNIDETKESPFKIGNKECSVIFKYLLRHLNLWKWETINKDNQKDDNDNDNKKSSSKQLMILESMKIIVEYFCFETDSIETILGLYLIKTPVNEEQQANGLVEQILYHQQMCIDTAIPRQCWDEAEILLHIIWTITNKQTIKKQITSIMKEFVTELYKSRVDSSTLASVITKLCLENNSFKENIAIAKDINTFLKNVYDDSSSSSENDNHQDNIINFRTHESIESQLSKYLNDAIDKVDERINILKKDEKEFNRGHEKTCMEMRKILDTIIEVKLINMKPGPTREKHLKTVKKLFVVLNKQQSVMISKKVETPRGIESEFKKMVQQSSLLYSETLNSLSQQQQQQQNQSSSSATKGKSKKSVGSKQSSYILKESKFLPILTFALEKYESTVIKYEKKFKIPTLGKYFKKTAVNDLKIADNDDVFMNNVTTSSENDDDNDNGGGGGKRGGKKGTNVTNKKVKKTPNKNAAKKPAPPKQRKSSPKPPTKKKFTTSAGGKSTYFSATSKKPSNIRGRNDDDGEEYDDNGDDYGVSGDDQYSD